MNIKVVTDSTADLPLQIASELGITVVPAYVCFGSKKFRDRVDIDEVQFYHELASHVYPNTVPPTPQDFANVYRKLSKEADGIISIHLSAKLSATINSALRAKEQIEGFPIEVIDSQSVTLGVGLLAILAGNLAVSGIPLTQIVNEVRDAIPRIKILGYLDTLKYLARGGRIGKTKALLCSIMSVKPLLTVKDGEIEPVSRVRSRDKGIDTIVDFVKNARDIQDMAIVYGTSLSEAQALAGRLGTAFTRERIRLAHLGPVLGVHTGPGILFVALLSKSV